MDAVPGKSLLYLLLTVGFQLFFMSFHVEHDIERRFPYFFFSYVLPVLLLIVTVWQWCTLHVFKQRAWMAENPAQIGRDMLNWYVRFKGWLTEKRTLRLPLSRKECA